MNKNQHRAYFAAGCFWGVEDFFQKLEGVVATRAGFSGGDVEGPTYERVCTGDTGHAEVVEVFFDSSEISYKELVQKFFTIHDPSTLNRQGADIGTQYRSALFYVDETQKEVAESVKDALEEEGVFKKIVTEIKPFEVFYPAEEYHQKYKEKQRSALK